jgi:hypothetical protein
LYSNERGKRKICIVDEVEKRFLYAQPIDFPGAERYIILVQSEFDRAKNEKNEKEVKSDDT